MIIKYKSMKSYLCFLSHSMFLTIEQLCPLRLLFTRVKIKINHYLLLSKKFKETTKILFLVVV